VRGRSAPRLVADPGEIGAVPQAAFLIVPDPTELFRARARRLDALVAGNPFAPFLEFSAALAWAQHLTVAQAPPLPPREAAGGDAEIGPLLGRGPILAAGDWREYLQLLAARLDAGAMPAAAAGALRALAARPAAETAEFADRVLDRRFAAAQAAEAVFLMAALQVAWTRRAAAISPSMVRPRTTPACPLCGAAAVASRVGAAGERRGLRFLACSLCAAEWHYVRIKCTACGGTQGVDYRAIDGDAGPAKAEACSECRAYSKIVYAEKDAAAEPFADDLGSLALDVLMADDGWRRACPNPFLVSPSLTLPRSRGREGWGQDGAP
jgi:FdhE protein